MLAKERAFKGMMIFEPRAENVREELSVQRAQQPPRRQEGLQYIRRTESRQV